MNIKMFEELIDNKKYNEIKEFYINTEEFDISVLLSDLPMEKLKQAFRLLPKDMASDVFTNFDSDLQHDLIIALTSKEQTAIIEDMYRDDAADLFDEMSAGVVSKMLSKVDKETRDQINALLKYPKDSAGSIMTVEFIHLKKDYTIKDSIERIRKQKDEFVSFDNCFVTDERRKLLGTVAIKELLVNNPYTLIEDVMEECTHPIHTLMDQEEVAKIFKDYNYNALPVVDSENRLVGIITIDDIVDIIEKETSEDINMMNAIITSDQETPYLKKSAWELYKGRIPWLLILLISSLFTGTIITSYESALASYVVLTSFIPMIMDTGGNAGSQASVTIIRALSLDEIEFKDIFKVIFKEIRVAVLCGITIGIVNFLRLLLINNTGFLVSFIVSITLVFTIFVAKIIGASLPMLAKKIHLDPAVMASPFITTIVDATSLIVYFKIACTLLGI